MWRRLAISLLLISIYAVIYYYMHYVPSETIFLVRVQKIQCEVSSKKAISSLFPESDYDRETFLLEEGTEVWVIFHEKPGKDLRARIIEEGKNSKEVMDFAQWDSDALIVSFDESGIVKGYRWRIRKRGELDPAGGVGPRMEEERGICLQLRRLEAHTTM